MIRLERDGEIVDGKCVLHPTRALNWTEERNWFFRLSRYAPFLERLFADRRYAGPPEARRRCQEGMLRRVRSD